MLFFTIVSVILSFNVNELFVVMLSFGFFGSACFLYYFRHQLDKMDLETNN